MFDEIGKQNSSNLAKFLDYENPQELDFHNFGFVTVDQHKLHNKYRIFEGKNRLKNLFF